MKKVNAYALIGIKNIAVTSGQLPIYWDKQIAEEEAEKLNLRVIKVEIS